MSNTMRAVGADEPLMIAWKAYQQTDEYADTLKWAERATKPEAVQSAETTMWAAFTAGFVAGGGKVQQ